MISAKTGNLSPQHLKCSNPTHWVQHSGLLISITTCRVIPVLQVPGCLAEDAGRLGADQYVAHPHRVRLGALQRPAVPDVRAAVRRRVVDQQPVLEVLSVLAGSGHIAGVVNPPSNRQKYQYWTGPDPEVGDVDAWVAKATEHPGSWWPDWLQWLRSQDSTTVPARPIGGGKLKAIEDAPGSYVRVKS